MNDTAIYNTPLVRRFLSYISFDTQSNCNNTQVPSTPGQMDLAAFLVDELHAMGITDAMCDPYGRVYGHIPSSEGCTRPGLALIAHMDTAMDLSGADIKPQIFSSYDGTDIILNKEKHILTSTCDFPILKEYTGQDLIVTDGTTLLGADDKAGIAEIMTLCQYLMDHPDFPHPKICIHFTPDEEIGRGADHTDLNLLDAAYGYTVDGGMVGEFSYENFNAAAAVVTVHGITAHTGYAKGILKNAIQIAMEYQALLPVYENPACTEGREGFYHIDHIEGSTYTTVMKYLIRDHDHNRYKERQRLMEDAVLYMNRKYGPGTVEIQITESYLNMYQQIEHHHEIIENVKKAMIKADVTPIIRPIRGGTDGARLSYMGLPCPNICTGCHNGHGRHEFISCQSMEKVVEILKNLVESFA